MEQHKSTMVAPTCSIASKHTDPKMSPRRQALKALATAEMNVLRGPNVSLLTFISKKTEALGVFYILHEVSRWMNHLRVLGALWFRFEDVELGAESAQSVIF